MGTNLPVGILKLTPEDFVVQEVIGNPPEAVPFSSKTIIHGWDGKSAVTVFEMSKYGMETQEALKEVARQLGVSFHYDISTHGTKDKRAHTSQRIGVRGEFRPNFSHQRINLVQLSGRDSDLERHEHVGNRFNIFVQSDALALDLAKVAVVPNFFGKQRLGQLGSEHIGRLFLEGEPEQAIDLLLTTPAVKVFREVERKTGGSWEDVLVHPDFQFTFTIEIHKWQSYLWNKLFQEKMDELGESLPAQLPYWSLSPDVYPMYRHLWHPPQLNERVLRMINTSQRPTLLRPGNFQAKREELGWRFVFDLPRGSYATVVLDQLFKLDEKRYATTAEELARERDEFLDSLIARLSHRL